MSIKEFDACRPSWSCCMSSKNVLPPAMLGVDLFRFLSKDHWSSQPIGGAAAWHGHADTEVIGPPRKIAAIGPSKKITKRFNFRIFPVYGTNRLKWPEKGSGAFLPTNLDLPTLWPERICLLRISIFAICLDFRFPGSWIPIFPDSWILRFPDSNSWISRFPDFQIRGCQPEMAGGTA